MVSDRPTYTPQHVLWLIEWLPDTSAFAASQHGGRSFLGWGWDRVAAARTIDAVNVNTTVAMRAAAGKKGKSIRPPKPVKTPFDGMTHTKKPKVSLAQFAQALAARRRR